MNSPLLLDTHIWIWLMTGDKALGNKALATIRKAATSSDLFVSSISMWEVAMLESKGRIALGCSTYDWIDRALSTLSLSLATITPEIAIDSCYLPNAFHKDPADRIIVATARKMNLSLVTRDERILQYSKQGFLNTVAG